MFGHSTSDTRLDLRFGKLLRVCLLAAALLPVCAAHGQSTDTLEKIRKTRVVTLGVRDASMPFSAFSANGQASGYSVDLCNKVAEQLRKELKLPDLKVDIQPVTASNRFSKLKSGAVDIDCEQSVNTRSRAAELDFSYSIYVAGERLLSRADAPIGDIQELAGKSVGFVKGTTADKLFTQLQAGQLTNMKLVAFDNSTDAFAALQAGKIQAMAQIDIILEALRAQSGSPNRFVLSGAPLSVEPIALVLRKGDNNLRAVVDRTLTALYSSGEINAIYDRWFNTASFKVPMPRMMRECITRPNHEPGVALGLGYAL